MIAGILILNSQGETLVSKFFRDDVGRGVAEAFRHQVIAGKDYRSPVVSLASTSFVYIQEKDVYLVAVSKHNVDCCLVLELLYQIVRIFKSYFKTVDEDAIKTNFVLIYELLDELLDYGYPQTTEVDALKLYITQKGFVNTEKLQANLTKLTAMTTGSTPWRAPGIKYKKNEVYLDVIESVNLLMSASGTILHADVSGKIIMKTYLSGMPECKFGINDKLLMANEAKQGKRSRARAIVLDDITLHQCVRLGKFESDRTVAFTPPDGEFELMSYRTTENINLPFRVISHVKEVGRNRVECEVTVKSTYPPQVVATQVRVIIPTPKNTALCKTVIKGSGRAKYSSDVGGILWKIPRFPGNCEYVLRANIELIANVTLEEKTWSRPPISMEFQVPMFTASGLQIRYLRVVEKSGYETIKVRSCILRKVQRQHLKVTRFNSG